MDELKEMLKRYPQHLPLDTLATILNVPIGRVNDLINQPGFPIVRVDKRRLVPKEKFIKWVMANVGKESVLPRSVIASVPKRIDGSGLPVFLRPSNVSEVLGISLPSSTRLLKEEGCPSIRIGNRIVTPVGEFFSWLKEHPKLDEKNHYHKKEVTRVRVARSVQEGLVDLSALPEHFDVRTMREVFKISKASAYDLISIEGFPKIRTDNRIIVPRDEFLEWLNKYGADGN